MIASASRPRERRRVVAAQDTYQSAWPHQPSDSRTRATSDPQPPNPSIPASSLHRGHTGNRRGSRTGLKRWPHKYALIAPPPTCQWQAGVEIGCRPGRREPGYPVGVDQRPPPTLAPRVSTILFRQVRSATVIYGLAPGRPGGSRSNWRRRRPGRARSRSPRRYQAPPSRPRAAPWSSHAMPRKRSRPETTWKAPRIT